jgi:glutamate-1-semialdehyde 2,1-aminomutase
MTKGGELYERAKRRIPGGTQLLSKRPELYLPGEWPAYFSRARGAEVEDLDGRRYVDVSNHAVGSCPLGYADPEVNAAVIEAVQAGSMASLNCPEEPELAEALCELHPWADMVRYARSGGEAMAIAVRLARAASGREVVAFSGYHGWHDWYLAASLDAPAALDRHLLPGIDPAGVPRRLAGTALPFAEGDLPGLEAIAARHTLAAIVLEPARSALPAPGYLEAVRELARKHGAVLVLDEITTGFRLALGGAHRMLGVEPDVAVFAKAMSNGYPMAAVIGRRAVMEAAQRSFVSSTYWSERVGPAAALATLKKMRAREVPAHLAAMGERMRAGLAREAARAGLQIAQKGLAPLPSFAFQHGADARVMHTLYTQGMLDQGYLASGAFYASYAHSPAMVDAALAASARAFAAIRAALDAGRLRESLRGAPAEAGLSRRGP